VETEQVIPILGRLIGGTTGWDDQASEIYLSKFMQLVDLAALDRAVDAILRMWTEARRPPLAVVLDEYTRQVKRAEMQRRPNALSERYPSFAEGVEIAWNAYCKEVRGLGREPDRRKFEKWLPV